ncbi:unnamed protein product [Didymodactylos carnosus]|uniref:Uncharacterized protein n=1 Tax=Didymodactylos carnosus TaxID=1234261 RepID=A0A815BPB9_9BILA|nr:unnamed protein product [Didymodactylos carnosus]CAF1272316.1 unnamed protein product [Didymodactylos carnosus]CAF3796301.1 unnamed protein product [Didymodactylos carnosus]CAF4061507.1 unnamed protein product [Didymodactylos carnosus]
MHDDRKKITMYPQVKNDMMRNYIKLKRFITTQNRIAVLLLFVLIIGTLLLFRSYRSMDIPQTIEQSNEPVHVDFYVMSKCPDAKLCETKFADTLIKLSSIINFTVNFIATEPKPNEFECMHGNDECTGDKQQLCVQHLASQTVLLKFLQCQSETILNIPDNAEKCLTDTSLKYSDVKTCVDEQGNLLLHNSIQRTVASKVKNSCTMYLNNKFWCKHDGVWTNCAEGNDETSLITAICKRYTGERKSTICPT